MVPTSLLTIGSKRPDWSRAKASRLSRLISVSSPKSSSSGFWIKELPVGVLVACPARPVSVLSSANTCCKLIECLGWAS